MKFFKYIKGDTINDYFGRVMGIVNKMRSHGNKIEDEAVVEKILRSLEPRFDNVMFFCGRVQRH